MWTRVCTTRVRTRVWKGEPGESSICLLFLFILQEKDEGSSSIGSLLKHYLFSREDTEALFKMLAVKWGKRVIRGEGGLL